MKPIGDSTREIRFAGLIFVGLGSLMDVHGIRNLPPSVGAVILSLESVFAVLAGWLFLAETMSHQAVPGCGLMFSAIFIVQLKNAYVRDDDRAGPHKAPGRQPRHA